MEIKINKEIRTYRETLFFGLSVRQFICSVLAVSVAVALYRRRGSRGRCRIFSVQRPHAGAILVGVAEIRGYHGRQACLESGKLL